VGGIGTGFFVSDFWEHQLVDHGRQYIFLVFVGFIGSFGFIRLSARLMRSPRVPWWPGSVVSESGLHLHHLVWGITMMMGAGVVSFALLDSGWWYEVSAFVFGVGMGLTIDEFALWIYLDDVYWSREGRRSIDASVIAVAFMGLILVGGFSIEVKAPAPFDVLGTAFVVAVILAVSIVCFLKQRVFHGAIGLLVTPIAIYGAVRIGKPHSPWARRFYSTRRPGKQAKAERRFRPDRRTERVKERVRDAIGGVTGEEYEARLAGRDPAPRLGADSAGRPPDDDG
jgi:lysyl-tRNA synthetase class 2